MLASQEEDAGHVHLDVSHPVRPTFLSVGNDPRLGVSFSPIIALLATVCMQQMNQQGKHKSVFMQRCGACTLANPPVGGF